MLVARVHRPGPPDALIIEDLPIPSPGPHEIRIKTMAIGVGGADIMIRKGIYKWMPPLPATPGMELSGVVDALGEGVTQWQIGQPILVSSRDLLYRGGCYVQYITVPESTPYLLPNSISFADAVSLPNLQLALALFKAANFNASQSRKTVFINGASGGVALMLAQVARRNGFKTIGSSRTKEKAAFALAGGFDEVIEANPSSLQQKVMEMTDGLGVELAYDHLGGAFFPACVRSLSPLGLAISYNIITGPPQEDMFSLLRELLGKSLGIRCFSMHTFDEDKKNRRQLMQEAISLMSNGDIQAPPTTLITLKEVIRAHEYLEAGSVAGKIILDPNG